MTRKYIKKMSQEDRFWNKVKLPDYIGTDECWEWAGCRTPNGYGKVCMNYIYIGAYILGKPYNCTDIVVGTHHALTQYNITATI